MDLGCSNTVLWVGEGYGYVEELKFYANVDILALFHP